MARRSRNLIGLGIGAFLTFLYLTSQQRTLFGNPRLPRRGIVLRNENLAVRLDAAEESFQRSLKKREALIKRFGPTVDKLQAYPHMGYTLWDLFVPSFQCPHDVERIGNNGDGGKFVCGLYRVAEKPVCVVYSFGIHGESSFEAEILERTLECQVWGYDSSVTSFGPEVTNNKRIAYRAHFQPWGLSDESDHGYKPSGTATYTLIELMNINGHEFIDILKMDIEASEFSTLTDLLKLYHGRRLPFGQLQVKLHAWRDEWQNRVPEFLQWWESLEEAGLRAFSTEPNLVHTNANPGAPPELVEYSFINTYGNHALIEDPIIL